MMDNKQMFEAVSAKMKEKEGLRLPLHNCSICHFTCYWVYDDGQLFYNTGCYCTNMSGGLEPRDESGLKQHFDWNWENKHTIKQVEDFLSDEL